MIPVILHDDGFSRFAIARNLVVAVWFEAPRAVQLHGMGRLIGRVAQEWGGDFGVLNVIHGGTPEFSGETRIALSALVGDATMHGRGVAHVFLVGGLVGAAARVFLGTAMLVGRAGPLHRIFTGVPVAAAWLAGRFAGGCERWTVDEVARAHAFTASAPVRDASSRA